MQQSNNNHQVLKKHAWALWLSGVLLVFIVFRTWQVYGVHPLSFAAGGMAAAFVLFLLLLRSWLELLGQITNRHYDVTGRNIQTGKNQLQELIASPHEMMEWNAQGARIFLNVIFSHEYAHSHPLLVKKIRAYYWIFTGFVLTSFLLILPSLFSTTK